ncbi:MAG TPA: hypothetical protein VEB64_15200 [Azospirillaceae bacterium]|nr:hypothetical protein [Azospirillaceae bacterium]
MADKPPHQKHHELAHTLLRTFYEALEPHMGKGHITKDELDKAFALMASYWPKVLPLFAVTCKVCQEQSQRTYNPDARRKDFLTRIVFSYIVANVAPRMDSLSGKKFPQVIVRGIQKNVTSIFHEKEYETLNLQAQTIFSHIGTDDDREAWTLISKDETMQLLADKIMVRLLLRFKQFNHQRQVFTRNITLSLLEDNYAFTDQDFCLIFQAMFGKFEDALKLEEGRLKVDLYYGEETAEKLGKIFFHFNQFKQSAELSAQSQAMRKSGAPSRQTSRR